MSLIPLIQAPNLEKISKLKHGFTTRDGGVSGGPYASLNLGRESGDQDESVDQNYERLAQAFGTIKNNIVGSHQVHGAEVVYVKRENGKDDYWGTDADALITNATGPFLTVRTADCCPILLVDEEHKGISAVHAGWRGTLAKVLPATILEMQKQFRTDPTKLKVAIGPGIGRCCYEVSYGISSLMEQELGLEGGEAKEKKGGVYLDLAQINARLAKQCGAHPDQIWVSGLCTRCDEKKFFSFRRDGKHSGRLVGIIGWSA